MTLIFRFYLERCVDTASQLLVSKSMIWTMRKAMVLLFFISILVLLPSKAQTASWHQIWGPVGLVEVGYDMIEQQTVVYATNRSSGEPHRYGGIPFSWEKVGENWQYNPNGPPHQPLNDLAVGGRYGRLYGLYGIQVFRYMGKKGWEWLGGPYDSICGVPGWLYAISTGDKQVFDYDWERHKYQGLPWAYHGGPAKQLALGDSDQLYRIPPDESGVWEFNWSKWNWTQIGGPAKAIYAGGNELFAVSPGTGNIYRYNGNPYSWTKIGGPGKMFAVDYVGRLYGLSPDGSAVFMYNGKPMKWTKIGGAAESIHTGGYEHRIYATSPGSYNLWELRIP